MIQAAQRVRRIGGIDKSIDRAERTRTKEMACARRIRLMIWIAEKPGTNQSTAKINSQRENTRLKDTTNSHHHLLRVLLNITTWIAKGTPIKRKVKRCCSEAIETTNQATRLWKLHRHQIFKNFNFSLLNKSRSRMIWSNNLMSNSWYTCSRSRRDISNAWVNQPSGLWSSGRKFCARW